MTCISVNGIHGAAAYSVHCTKYRALRTLLVGRRASLSTSLLWGCSPLASALCSLQGAAIRPPCVARFSPVPAQATECVKSESGRPRPRVGQRRRRPLALRSDVSSSLAIQPVP